MYKFKNAIICLLVMVLLIGTFIIIKQADEQKYTYVEVVSHKVWYGETLWSIAAAYSNEGQDIRRVIHIIRELSGCTAQIRAGEMLTIPVYD